MTPPRAPAPWLTRIARWRVPAGFACAAAAFVLAHPTSRSIVVGLAVAAPGELLRVWASGHLDKGREVTTSGPYRFVRHPLYAGSIVLGAGFVVASRSVAVAVLAASYLAVTLLAAIRTEEARLDARFEGAYSRYRQGLEARGDRRFSLERLVANREYPRDCRICGGVRAAVAPRLNRSAEPGLSLLHRD